MKSENPISAASPSVLKALFLASRPKTWSASLCPVFIGVAMAARERSIDPSFFALTLLFSLLIQIGTNFANDYFDFQKGADTSERIGPKRAVQQGWIRPCVMLFAAHIVFLAAFLCALPLMAAVGWWGVCLAALCILLGILYTGGPKPLGYAGWGEVLVFIFFGPVPTIGAYFLQTNTLNSSIFVASLAPGFFSAAILLANNLRDVKTDRIAKKRTLVVRFGVPFGKWLYVTCIVGAVLSSLGLIAKGFSVFLVSSSIICCFAPIRKIFRSEESLQETSLLLMLYTLVFCFLLI